LIQNPQEHFRGEQTGECDRYHFAPIMAVIPAKAGIHCSTTSAPPTTTHLPGYV
jgi:hypothetical protein